ncbi:hypothetical protein JXM83_05610 [Candidatus Woesearchaeota archaeon]|nr:hypothetical protein [Candidatus Woesearchaeota archaeon]
MPYNRIDKKKLVKNVAFQILILATILISIYCIRANYFDKTIPKSDSYYNYRLSTTTITDLIQKDSKLYYERFYITEPFYVLINVLSSFLPQNAISLVPFILAILSFIGFSIIISKITDDKTILISSGILFATSPELMYLAGTFNPGILTIFLISMLIISLINFEEKNMKLLWGGLSILLTIILSITNIFDFLFLFFLLIAFYFIINKQTKHKQIYYILFFISLLVFLGTNYTFLSQGGTEDLINNYKYNPDSMLTELSAKHGIRLIDIILTGLGIGIIWTKKRKYYISSITLILITVLSFKLNETTSLLFPIYAITSGYAISYLLRRDWELKYLKKLSIIVILIITISSTIQYIGNLSYSNPSQEQYKAFNELGRIGNKNEVVFSSLENGFYIELLSNKIAILDENLNNIKNMEDKLDKYYAFLNTRDINVVQKLTNEWNITYIVIDEDMVENIWKNKEEGLLFVIKNSDMFEEIRDYDKIKIYKINTFNSTIY